MGILILFAILIPVVGAFLLPVVSLISEKLRNTLAFVFVAASFACSAALLKSAPDDLPDRIESLQREAKGLAREIEALTDREISALVESTLKEHEPAGPARLYVRRYDRFDADGLRKIADGLRGRDASCVAVLATGKGGRVSFVAAAGADAVAAGADAGRLVKAVAEAAGGGGGGRRDMAQAGGRDAALIESALQAGRDAAIKQLTGK